MFNTILLQDQNWQKIYHTISSFFRTFDPPLHGPLYAFRQGTAASHAWKQIFIRDIHFDRNMAVLRS